MDKLEAGDLLLCLCSTCWSDQDITDEDTVKRHYAKFEEKFFQTFEKELAKINTFYSELSEPELHRFQEDPKEA
ncbi:unnamed protein product [Pleuronectes platessa]|uniref:Uncharacterized protein n=1 Tax=Pleuronectes platessa TaxID=8262 RepID=A0A9N7Y951_PLEPL|nr:unnamed protein product [Pleuronectes platessa]